MLIADFSGANSTTFAEKKKTNLTQEEPGKEPDARVATRNAPRARSVVKHGFSAPSTFAAVPPHLQAPPSSIQSRGVSVYLVWGLGFRV